jgi:hypothetical protein
MSAISKYFHTFQNLNLAVGWSFGSGDFQSLYMLNQTPSGTSHIVGCLTVKPIGAGLVMAQNKIDSTKLVRTIFLHELSLRTKQQ